MTIVDIDATDEVSYARQAGLVLIAQAETLKVVDAASFAQAGELRHRLKAQIEMVKGFWGPKKARSRAVWQADVDDEKAMLAGPEAALVIVDKARVTYEQTLARERTIAEARAAEEAKRIEAARPAPAPGQAPLPPVVVPPVRVEMPVRDAGGGFATYWKAGPVTDKVALARAVADGQVGPHVIEGNAKVLDDMARASKEALSIPGVGKQDEAGRWVSAVSERRARG